MEPFNDTTSITELCCPATAHRHQSGPSAFPAPLWSTFLLQFLSGPVQHLLFHPGEIQPCACLGVAADGPQGILMCCSSPSPGRQLLALQRDRHWVPSGFFGMEAEFYGVGTKHMCRTPWQNKHLVQEQDKAKLVPPSHVGQWPCLHCLLNHTGAILPFSLSPQGQARRIAPPAPPRALHPTGAVSPPAERVSTPPTATGCPTKSARGRKPPEQSQG